MGNPYDAAAADLFSGQLALGARSSVTTVADRNPDAEAEVQARAKQLGVPYDSARANPEIVDRRTAANAVDYHNLARQAPRTSQFLASTSNAAIAHDDVSALGMLEHSLSTFINPITGPAAIANLLTSAGKRAAADTTADVHKFGGVANYLGELGKSFAPINVVRHVAKGGLQMISGLAGAMEGGSEVNEKLDITAGLQRRLFGQSAEGALAGLSRGIRRKLDAQQTAVPTSDPTQAGQAVGMGLESIPVSMGALATTIATDGVAPGLALIGSTTYGQSYGQSRDEGASVGRATARSAIDAAVEMGTEYFPEKWFLKDIHGHAGFGKFLTDQIKSEVPGEQVATLLQDFNQWALIDKNKGKSFEDYANEIVPHAVSTLIATGVGMAASAGLGATVAGIGNLAQRQAQVNQANEVAQHLEDMGKLAKASKLRERAPDTFQGLVDQMADGSQAESVYVAPEALTNALFQGGFDEEQAKAVDNALGPRVKDAIEQGTDVQMPIAEFARHIAGTPAEKALIDHLKVDPHGMTRAEAEEFMATQGDALKGEIEKELQRRQDDEGHAAEVDKVRGIVLDELNKANRFTPKVNERYADLHAAFYATMAQRLNVSPNTLYERYPLRIVNRAMPDSHLSQIKEIDPAIRAALLSHPRVQRGYDLKENTKLWRGEGDHSGGGMAYYGVGLYATTDKNYAAKYGAVREVKGSERADNVLRFKSKEDFDLWVQDAFPQLGYEDKSKFAADFEDVGHFIRSLDPSVDGLQIGSGKHATLVVYPVDPELHQSADSPIFYSELEKALVDSKQSKASGEQWLATLSKTPGVKKEEIEWTELPEWLASQQGPVTREELLDFVRGGGVQVEEVDQSEEGAPVYDAYEVQDDDGNSVYEVRDRSTGEVVDTFDSPQDADSRANELQYEDEQHGARTPQFSTYTEDGGEDYHELLLTLPPGVRGNPERAPSTHFDEPGVVAHLRFKTRQTTDGKKLLFIEEVQSDWHQKGRDQGYEEYVGDIEAARIRDNYKAAQAAWSEWYDKAVALGVSNDSTSPAGDLLKIGTPEAKALIEEGKAITLRLTEAQQPYFDLQNRSGIPDAPFKATWPALAMKRAIRWAADNGFEAVAWTTGDQQRERYNLASTIGEVQIRDGEGDGTYNVRLPSASGAHSTIIERGLGHFPDDRVGDGGVLMTAEQIGEVFGKDLGSRMLALADQAHEKDKFTTIQGDDLKIGGEGMNAFYDRNLVNITNNILKKLGGSKVEMVPVEGMEPSASNPATAARIAAERALQDHDVSLFGAQRAVDEDHIRQIIPQNRTALAADVAAYQKQLDDYRATPASDGFRGPGHNDSYTQSLETRIAGAQDVLDQSADLEALIQRWHQREPMREAVIAARNAEREAAPGTNPGFTITPEMAQHAREGFALFQKNRGAYSPASDTISLLEHADLSTFLHESGHFYLEVLSRMADGDAPQQVKDDFDALLNWFGVKDRAAWNAMSLEEKRKSHEKFARGFEAYLFTGRAPAPKLRDLFRTFRSWLVAVYRHARNLGVQPTQQVRSVMDRLLATDEEIAQAQAARSMEPLFKDQQSSGMSEDQWRDYQRTNQTATQEASADLSRRSLRDLKWFENAKGREVNRLKRQADAIRKSTRARVAAEVAAEPVYRAQQYLKRGVLDGEQTEGPHKLSIESVDKVLGDSPNAQEVKRKLGYGKYGILAEEGLGAEATAQVFGFTSADHMIQSLVGAEPMRDRIAGITEQRLLEENGDLTDPQAIDDAASEAVHNEFRARAVAAELAALAKASGKPRLLAQAARQFAEDTVARTRVRDLKPAKYEAAASRAAKAALKALGEGNLAQAALEKRNQLFNLYATKGALKARDEVTKALGLFDRLTRPASAKSLDPSYRDQIVQLLDRYDLNRGTTLKAIDKRVTLADWVERQREQGLDPAIPDDIINDATKRSYKQLTVEELRGLVDTVKSIEHLGRLKNKLLTAKKDRDFAEAVDRAASTIIGNAVSFKRPKVERNSWADRAKTGVFDYLALHRKFASLIRQMDGFKDGGPLWELFVRPMNAAGDNETQMRHDATAKLIEIMAPLVRENLTHKQFVPEIGTSLSLEGRLAVALNMGNETNRARLRDGDNWTDEQIDALGATLTAQQWGVVQAVWDHVNSYWPQIAAKQRRVTGVEPEKVEGDPFQVVTADGQTLQLPGGYYPIKYDTDRSTRSEADDMSEVAKAMLRGAYTKATTRRGHTQARVDTVKRPVRKDIGVIGQHLTEVIHDLSWHEYLIDATRLLGSSQIDGAVRDHYGPEVLRAMRNTLTDVAAGEIPAKNSFERAVNWLRTGATISGMAWSMTTALLQPLGLAQSIKRIGFKPVARGLGRWLGDSARMQSTVKWITEQSPMMAQRANTLQREINEIRNTVVRGKASATNEAVKASFFYLIAKLQLVADVPTWIGQYQKSVDAGEEHDRAVALADQAVLDSQGGGQLKDQAGIQRAGGPLLKVWTNFYSYFSVTYNLAAESVGETRLVGASRLPLLAADFILLFVLPNAIQTLMLSIGRGDDKDWPEIAKEMGVNSLMAFPQSLIGVRDIAAAISGDERSQAPAGIVGRQFYKLGTQAQQGHADEAFWKSLNQVTGILFHYPAQQVQRTSLGIAALANGETHNPAAVLLGPPQQHKKQAHY